MRVCLISGVMSISQTIFVASMKKAHDLGWDLSPIDLVMSNSILEPIFTRDQHEVKFID